MMALFDLGLTEGLLQTVKIIAAVGGAVVGWFVCDPLTRLVYRLSYRAPTPGPVLLLSKGAGAAILAVVIYLAISLGSGWGPGKGGGPGKGSGLGGDKVASDGSTKDGKIAAKDKDKDKADASKTNDKVETIQIEILGGKRFVDDGKDRFYLVARKEPALSIGDLDDYFKKHEAKITVVAILTKDTGIESELIGSPLDKLRKSAAQHKIKVLTSTED